MITLERKDFVPADTFECGQCFRWYALADGSYTGIAFGNIAHISFDDKKIYIDGDGDEDFWTDYLDLERDYESIKRKLSERDEKIGECIRAGNGIHILNQDRWETIISFIISQNNNIGRIKKCIDKLCRCFGEKKGELCGKEFFSFPSKEVLSQITEEDLAPVRLGYRAKYIIGTAGYDFDPNDDLTYDDLLRLPGVGPKVANCIMLFAYRDFESFPVDVWVKRVMNRIYGFDENDVTGMKEFAKRTFGDDAGLAQQYLFHSIRNMEKDT